MAHDIIVLGASAGGVEALVRLVQGLPAGLPASLFVVCHTPASGGSQLPDILSRRGRLLAVHARDLEPARPGQIYVAPPDHHLLLRRGVMRLWRGARENHHRPAIDPLFRSAAAAYGPRVVGVVLSGSLNDGAAGLLAVRNAGGVAVVQDPAEAAVDGMPRAALAVAGADYVLRLDDIARLLTGLATEARPDEGDPSMSDPIDDMPDKVELDMAAQEAGDRRGQLTVFTCPECGGALWQVDEKALTRFRCHVGHAYYGEALLAEQDEALEAALWTAVRTFKEKTVLARQLGAYQRGRGDAAAAARCEEEDRQAEGYADLIVEKLLRAAPPGGEAAAG
jgi:two-component system chemotaxis response regulator CheB